MTTNELRHIGQKVYGEYWRNELAKALGVSRVTVWRWLTKRTNISKPAAMAIRSLARR